VIDNYKIHKAKAVEERLATHPCVRLLFLPTNGPRAKPIEQALSDAHHPCPRNHTRKRWRELMTDVEDHLQRNGPWPYKLSNLHDEPAVTQAVERIARE
jgi:transposase